MPILRIWKFLEIFSKDWVCLNQTGCRLVIGNHDIFGGPQTPEDIFTFPERCKNVPYENKVKEFGEYFSETFKNCIYKNEDHVFPFVKILDNVMISGFNSIAKYSKLKNPFGSNGEINFKQFQELSDIYRSYSKLVKHKLMLVHHHFNKIKIEEEILCNSLAYDGEADNEIKKKEKNNRTI